MITTSKKIPEFNFSHPLNNFSKQKNYQVERNFTINFAQSYSSQIASLHNRTNKIFTEMAREIPMNGFGIPDLISIAWNPDDIAKNSAPINVKQFTHAASPTVRAFEIKMENWKKALMQAHRYQYFSNVSIVVLPEKKLKVVSDFLKTFINLKIGLWGYNEITEKITTLFTPRPKKNPHFSKYYLKVIEMVSKATQSQHFF